MSRHPFWSHDIPARLQELQEELGQVLNRFRPSAMGEASGAEAPTELDPSTWVPTLDLVETPEEVRLWVDLPGVDPGAIDLTVTGTVLSLRGQRRPPGTTGSGREHVLERPFGPFARQVPLPCEVDVEKVEAHAKDGVLEIRLPKSDLVRPRTIPIRPS
jgi:HSP20 family protein